MRLQNAFQDSVSEAARLVSTQALLLKLDLPLQGYSFRIARFLCKLFLVENEACVPIYSAVKVTIAFLYSGNLYWRYRFGYLKIFKHQRFPEWSWRSFRRNWWRTSGEVWKEIFELLLLGKSSEAFSTKTPPQISPSHFTTRFWVVARPKYYVNPPQREFQVINVRCRGKRGEIFGSLGSDNF